MRRATWTIALGLAFAAYVLPQEPAHAAEAAHETEGHDPWLGWKWANFAILAVGLGYMIAKNAPALFAQRTREIEQSLVDAARTKKDAETQAAAIDQRFAGLAKEIEALRQEARTEMTAESERIAKETKQHLAKIQSQSGQEIALMSRAARDELRKYSAGLALDLATQRLRTRVTKNEEDILTDRFVQDLRTRVAPR